MGAHTASLVLSIMSLAATVSCACSSGGPDVAPVANDTWAEKCGSCHFAFQPGLLPSASWSRVLSDSSDHFGAQVELDAPALKALNDYAAAASADRSATKLSVKIVRSLGGAAPARITAIPSFRKKHKGIGAAVLERKRIGSITNCPACHRNAKKGVYDEHDVAIPQG